MTSKVWLSLSDALDFLWYLMNVDTQDGSHVPQEVSIYSPICEALGIHDTLSFCGFTDIPVHQVKDQTVKITSTNGSSRTIPTHGDKGINILW